MSMSVAVTTIPAGPKIFSRERRVRQPFGAGSAEHHGRPGAALRVAAQVGGQRREPRNAVQPSADEAFRPRPIVRDMCVVDFGIVCFAGDAPTAATQSIVNLVLSQAEV